MAVPGKYGSISFVVGLESQDPKVRQQAEDTWRSHAARAGHKKRARKPISNGLTSRRANRHQFRDSSENSTLPDPGSSQAWLAPVEDMVSGSPSSYSQLGVLQILETGQASPLILWRTPSWFKNTESADLLQFWLTKAAPFLVRGQPSHRGVLSVLVPSTSFSSSIVNHIMMAHSLTHWALIQAPSAQRTDLDRKALTHYTAAITAVRSSEATTVERLLTSSLGWTIEGLQGNLDRSQVHLDGLQALIEYGEDDHDVRQKFRPFLAHAQAVHAVVWERRRLTSNFDTQREDVFDNQPYDVETSRRTEQSYAWIISYISAARSRRSSSATQPEVKIHDGIGEWLQNYVERRSSSDEGSAQEDPENALRLLNDLVATMLPHDVVADFAGIDIDNPELVFTTVESCFNPILQTSWVDYVQLLGTLRVVLDLSLQVWPTEPWRSCTQSLLRAVDVCERSCLLGRQEALPTRRKGPKRRPGKV